MGSLEKNYLDVLYVHPEYSRQGIAYRIFKKLEEYALSQRQHVLETDASYIARPFFESQGFEVVRKNQNEHNGQVLVNFRMTKNLSV